MDELKQLITQLNEEQKIELLEKIIDMLKDREVPEQGASLFFGNVLYKFNQ